MNIVEKISRNVQYLFQSKGGWWQQRLVTSSSRCTSGTMNHVHCAASRASAVRRSRMRASAAYVCAQAHRGRHRAQALDAARARGCTRCAAAVRRHAILEHASPVLGSSRGRIGHVGDPWDLDAQSMPAIARGSLGRGARGGSLLYPACWTRPDGCFRVWAL